MAYYDPSGYSSCEHDGKAGANVKEENVTVSEGGGGTNFEDGVNFSKKGLEHMEDPERAVPVQTLQEAIRKGNALPDSRGSSAKMYYTTMSKNRKLYNFEVLYDEDSNTVYHFEYTREAIWNLPAIPK